MFGSNAVELTRTFPGDANTDYQKLHSLKSGGKIMGHLNVFSSGGIFDNKRDEQGGKGDSNKSSEDYALLGVANGASESEIKKAYLAKAKLYHPDSGYSPDRDLFVKVKAAYDRLSSKNNKLTNNTNNNNNTSSSSSVFGGEKQPSGHFYDNFAHEVPVKKNVQREEKSFQWNVSDQQQQQQPQQPPQRQQYLKQSSTFVNKSSLSGETKVSAPVDKKTVCDNPINGFTTLPLENFMQGAKIHFDYVRLMPCKKCSKGAQSGQMCFECGGSGKSQQFHPQRGSFLPECTMCGGSGVFLPKQHCPECKNSHVASEETFIDFDIEAGTLPGSTFSFDKKGHMGKSPVNITLKLEEDKNFLVWNRDLITNISVSFEEAVSGLHASIDLPSGERVHFGCSKPLLNGEVIKITGFGLSSTMVGHLYVVVNVRPPNDAFPPFAIKPNYHHAEVVSKTTSDALKMHLKNKYLV